MPRWMELIFVSIAIIILAPVFLIISILIYIESPGLPFFIQERIGRHGKSFYIWKFRKMRMDESPHGVGVTLEDDKRLTRVGRLIERFKLDEIPQFFNVLRGDMALVGPRAEIPKFVNHRQDEWEIVHSIRPGVFGYAQTKYTYESNLYPPNCSDPEKYYIQHILPEKLQLEIFYVQNRSLWFDLKIYCIVTCRLFAGISHIVLRGLRKGIVAGFLRNKKSQTPSPVNFKA